MIMDRYELVMFIMMVLVFLTTVVIPLLKLVF